MDGDGAEQKNERKYCYDCIKEAISFGYNGDLLVELADWYNEDNDYDKAFVLFDMFYRNYIGNNQNTSKELIPDVEYNLGLLYLFGQGTNTDLKKGMEMWTAYIGNVADDSQMLSNIALAFLGVVLKCDGNKTMIPVNTKLTIECIIKAASLGNETATEVAEWLKQYNIDVCYPKSYFGISEKLLLAAFLEKGYGIEADHEKARKLLKELGHN